MSVTGESLGYGWAMFLGLVQGLTEFLPVSSSGHLALVEHFGKGRTENLAFDILLHLATVLVIIGAFWKDFVRFWRKERMVVGYLIVSSVPTAVIGMLAYRNLAALREAPLAVCAGLLVTAAVLWAAERARPTTVELQRLGIAGSLLVGLAQALAMTPGISRSGLTIGTGLMCGLKREDAISFGFLLGVPAILGAAAFMALEIYQSGKGAEVLAALPPGPVLAGFLTAGLSGFVALRLLIGLVQKRKLTYFAAYCALLGIAGLVYFGLIR